MADALSTNGDALGAFINEQLAGVTTGTPPPQDTAGELHAVVRQLTWRRARVVAIELAAAVDPTLLDRLHHHLPHLTCLDFGRDTALRDQRQALWGHPLCRQLTDVRFRLPSTWLSFARDELLSAPVPRFTLVHSRGELAFLRESNRMRLEVSGRHPLLERAVLQAQQVFALERVDRV